MILPKIVKDNSVKDSTLFSKDSRTSKSSYSITYTKTKSGFLPLSVIRWFDINVMLTLQTNRDVTLMVQISSTYKYSPIN